MDSALNILATQHPSEKIYIHFDKEYYLAGETIWFKSYLYSDGKPSGMSTILYLQFVDRKGRVIFDNSYPAFGAVAKGNIDLPDTLAQGNYYIRAFTTGMLNYDEAFLYKKNIFVYNRLDISKTATIETRNVSLQFFPESGNLVDGILSVVGFKATDQWGNPVDINGIIKTEDKTTIASFKSFHDGIGKVQFKPQAEKKYFAEVETAAGLRTYPLPDVQASGINLKVHDEKGGKKFQLSRSVKDKVQYDVLMLVAQINNHIVYENEIVFEDYPSVIGHIVTDSLPSGILHFTVFNQAGIPVAERLSFVNNGEYRGNAQIGITKSTAEKRGENKFEINFPNTIQRSCSMAITDIQDVVSGDNDNIWSRFLLTSDLKGYIYNPAWYFTNQSDTSKQALDNLMLTHGWSRFFWRKILSGEFPEKKYQEPGLISFTGIVKDEKNNELVSGGKLNILLEAEDSTSQTQEVPVNTKGQFRLDSLMFIGKANFFYAYIGVNGKQKAAIAIVVEDSLKNVNSFVQQDIAKNSIERTGSYLQNKKDLDIRSRYIQSRLDEIKELEKVTIQAKTNKKPYDVVNEKYTSGVFRTYGKVNLDNINEPANDKSLNVVDYIKNSIQQIEIQNGRFVNRKNFSLISGQKWPIEIFLNNAPATMLELRLLRVDNVALIKFYEAGFVGSGSGAPGGAVAVFTKELFREEEKPDKLNHFEYKGFSVVKEFYNPDYHGADAKRTTVDNRTTLYWNPDVYTDTDMKSIMFNFFNNDFSKKMKIVLEGFDATGKLIHEEKLIGE
ncbi:MAG: hypothetical protein ACRDEB_01970 [Chitinophagaceae bacterium]